MRISDWSSDVCSSDLDRGDRFGHPVLRDRIVERRDGIVHLAGGRGQRRREREQGKGGEGEAGHGRSEEHTSELQSLMRISYAVFCLKKKKIQTVTYDSINTKENERMNITYEMSKM